MRNLRRYIHNLDLFALLLCLRVGILFLTKVVKVSDLKYINTSPVEVLSFPLAFSWAKIRIHWTNLRNLFPGTTKVDKVDVHEVGSIAHRHSFLLEGVLGAHCDYVPQLHILQMSKHTMVQLKHSLLDTMGLWCMRELGDTDGRVLSYKYYRCKINSVQAKRYLQCPKIN